MKNIKKKGQHSPVVQLFLKHLVSSNALFFIFPPQTLARVQRSAILRSQSRPREALLARTNYGEKKFASGTPSDAAGKSSGRPAAAATVRRRRMGGADAGGSASAASFLTARRWDGGLTMVCGCSVTPKPFTRDIGFVFDDTMTMAAQIRRVCQVAYCHIRGIANIRKCLSTIVCKIIHALVMSRLDFGNAMFYGLPETQLRKLQMIQNSAARLITGTRRRDHITPVLFSLHWLPVRQRIESKLLLLVFRAVHHLCPVYLSSIVIPYTPTRTLRSADQHLLTIPRYHLERYGRRAFSVAGPTLWNTLPPAIRQANSVAVFKSLLKTHIFREAFRTFC